MATDAEKRLEVAGADANLVFFFEDHALPLDQQYGLATPATTPFEGSRAWGAPNLLAEQRLQRS